MLVEEYVDGPEVTVTGFSAGGDFVPLAVTDRDLARRTGLRRAARLRLAVAVYAETAVEVTRRAVEALGIDEGPTTTRLRISRGGPEVIEVAARLGGGHETELVELVTGVDLDGARARGGARTAARRRARSRGRRARRSRRRGHPVPRRAARARSSRSRCRRA